MKLVRQSAEVRQAVATARREGERIALVPTMGYLHEGHLALIDRARSDADFVVLSVFVNPLQFGAGEDLERYPRSLERDAALGAERGAALLFAPDNAEMYPSGEPVVRVVPGAMADGLCGAFRTGHFTGVLTVVAKLFNIVEPDLAVFGQKDFQQAALIRRMVFDLNFRLRVEVAPTVREADGLAMSSRNAYLDAAGRERAVSLWHGLRRAQAAFRQGERQAERLRQLVQESLLAAGVEPQYVELVDPQTLRPVQVAQHGAVLAVAGFVGGTRLIDNLILSETDATRDV